MQVIYALNTKNDEHESAIQALKDAHEEEIQQILAETREKILQYKSRVSEELDLINKEGKKKSEIKCRSSSEPELVQQTAFQNAKYSQCPIRGSFSLIPACLNSGSI